MATIVTVTEGQSWQYIISPTGDHEEPITVSYSTSPGTATANVDYEANFADGGSHTFPPHEIGSLTLTLNTINDDLYEGGEGTFETYFFTANVQTGEPDVEVHVFDNDPRPVASVSGGNVVEGDGIISEGTLSFPIELSGKSASSITVFYEVENVDTNGFDFVTSSGSVTFNPGETVKQGEIRILGDQVVEGNERFLINISSSSDVAIGTGQAQAVIVNDDTAGGGPGGGKKGPVGTDGKDNLKGFGTGDTYIAMKGDDKITTGPGNDVIVFNEGDGKDEVKDFARGQDKVQLNVNIGSNHIDNFAEMQSLVGNGISLTSSKHDLTVAFDDGDQLTLSGINSFDAQDWLFIA